MKYTKNLRLKIPEGGDPIDISDITGNFESLDDEMSKKANSTGGDISSTTIKTLDPVVEKFPVPVAGESAKVFLGKVKKFIEDSNAGRKVQEVTLTAAGWSSSAPYTQTVSVVDITESDRPIVSLYLPAGITAANVKLQSKAYDCMDRAVTGAGNISIYCYNKKPTVDFQIQVKGV